MPDGHCVKSVRIWSYSGPHFSDFLSVFSPNAESTRIMRTRITPSTDTFHTVGGFWRKLLTTNSCYFCKRFNFAFFRSCWSQVFCKNRVFFKFLKIHRRTPVSGSLKLSLQLYQKKTLAQAFSYEFFEISKNPFFVEHLWWLFLIFKKFVKPSRTDSYLIASLG